METEKSPKEEWEQIGRDIEAKLRGEAAKIVGAEETADWNTIGLDLESKVRGEVAKGAGSEPDADGRALVARPKRICAELSQDGQTPRQKRIGKPLATAWKRRSEVRPPPELAANRMKPGTRWVNTSKRRFGSASVNGQARLQRRAGRKLASRWRSGSRPPCTIGLKSRERSTN